MLKQSYTKRTVGYKESNTVLMFKRVLQTGGDSVLNELSDIMSRRGSTEVARILQHGIDSAESNSHSIDVGSAVANYSHVTPTGDA